MRIGIDIGGSHIGVGLVNEIGEILLKKEKDIPHMGADIKTIIIETIKTYINEILKEQSIKISDIDYIGIAFPSALYNGKQCVSINLGIDGEIVKKEIKKYFRIPVYMKNDAKCAAICEKKFGAINDYSNVVFLTIGTGIGGAVFLNNVLLQTKENDLFEVGHMIIKSDGLKCKCGKQGCFEQYASITALKRNIANVLNIDKEITGIELYNIINQNIENPNIKDVLNEYIQDLCCGISNIIRLFSPQAICIGGSFVNYKEIFLRKIQEKLKDNSIMFNEACPQIILAKNKNDAGIIGAANII